MSQFTQQQLDQINQLLGQYITPLQRTPTGSSGGRPIYGYGRNTGGGGDPDAQVPIFDPNDSRLPPIQTTRFGGNTNQLQGDAADLADSARYDSILDIYRNAQNTQQGQFNETGQVLQSLRGNLAQGYDTARNEIQGQGEMARREILDRERTNIAAAGASARGRGLTGTTVLDSMRRGVQSDTNRSLTGLRENLAGQRSGLAERRAGAEYGAGNALAQFMQNRTGAETDLATQAANPVQRRSDLFAALQMARLQGAQGRSGSSGGAGSIFGSILGGVGGLLGGLGAVGI